jgi:O-antigen/teichoic acid export membrane protein
MFLMRNKLLQHTILYGGADFIFKVVGFAVIPIYTHLFSVEDFGIIATVSVLMGLIGLMMNLGVNNSVGRFYWDPATKDGQHALIVSAGLYQLLAVGVLITFIFYFVMNSFRGLIFERFGIEWRLLVLMLFTILPDQILQFALDTIRLHFTPLRFIMLSFLKNIMGVAIGLWLIAGLNWGLYGFFWGGFIASLLSVPVAFWFIRQELSLSLNREIARKIFHFGYPFLFTGLAYWIFGLMDRLLLAEFSNETQVGLYSIAFKFAAVVTFINTAFGQAWSPYAIKLLRDDENYRQTYSGIFSIWYFLLAILGCAIALFADELMILLTPREYWPASRILGFVAMGLVLFGTTQITALGISLEKKTRL